MFMTQVQQDTVEVTQVKRGRGRPQLTDEQFLAKETQRLKSLLVNQHNSNPVMVAMYGVTTEEAQTVAASQLASASEKVKLVVYGARKSAKTISDAITNAVAQNMNNAQIAMVVYSARNAKNKMTTSVSDTLQRLANGEEIKTEELPKELRKYM